MPKTITEITFDDWQIIKTTFISNGYSIAESEWAANNNLDPEGPRAEQIRRLLRNRRYKVAFLVRYTGLNRRMVIDDLADARKRNAEAKGAEDPMNLFMGES